MVTPDECFGDDLTEKTDGTEPENRHTGGAIFVRVSVAVCIVHVPFCCSCPGTFIHKSLMKEFNMKLRPVKEYRELRLVGIVLRGG